MGGKRVGVIGAGVAGLAAIKECLVEGLEPVCWEQAEDVGGLWNYTQEVKEGFPSIYNCCVINTSKEMTCFSDFPIPKEFPNFMSHRRFKEYIDLYTKEFGLRQHISFGQRVEKVEKAPDFSTSGRWTVTTRNLATNTKDRHMVDALLVCNGHLHEPNMPTIKGLDSFKGRVVHTRDIKDFHAFEKKRVLVIGIGNSGAEVACEASRHAERVYVSTRRGAYVIQRAGAFGRPFDLGWNCRWYQTIPHAMTKPIAYHRLNYKYQHSYYSLAPNVRFDKVMATISDDLPNRILIGAVTMHTNVASFKERSVLLEDGTTIEDIDVVILATGYRFSFPFLENGDQEDPIIPSDGHYPELFNLVFPVELEQRTLAVVGLVQPYGALPPVIEMQSRVATRVFSGKCQLPSQAEMRKAVETRRNFLRSEYINSPRYSLQVYFIDYMDTLGRMIGCKPSLWKMFFTDPKLWSRMYFGPATPSQWRLEGPGKWEGARKAIADVPYRTHYPMKTRVAGKGEKDGLYDSWLKVILLLLVISGLSASYLCMS